MSELLIKKNTNLTFTFILDGDTDNAVIDNQPNMTSTGIYFNFKTKNGANIIKKQFIQYSQITYKDVSDVEFTFLSVQEVWTKLINEGFFDYLGTSGGGSGVDRFDELLDTFSYIGNDGKVPVVDQSQLKLVPTTFYNFKDFIQLEDVAITELIEDKIISVALVSGVPKLVLKDNPADPVQLANVVGYMVYADEATQTTPIAFTTGVYVKITNDTLGVKTNTTNAPYGISNVWNEATNQFDFSQLSIGDQIDFNFDGNVTTTSSNQVVRLEVRLAIGSPSEETHTIFAQQVKTAATNERVVPYLLTIENDDYRNYPTEIWFVSDGNGSLGVKEFLARIIRKGINIVDVEIDLNEAVSNEPYNDLILGADNKLFVGGLVKKQYASSYSYSTGTTNAVFPLRESGASNYVLTSASLASVSGFDLSLTTGSTENPYTGKLIRVFNQTGNDITLKHFDDINAELPFYLKEGVNLVFPNNELIEFSYSSTELTETFRSWTTLIPSTDSLPEGSTNLYFTTARVLATLLTGVSFATGGAIVSTDTVLQAFGKIQKQINDLSTALSSYVPISRTISINGITQDLSANRVWLTKSEILEWFSGDEYSIQTGASALFTYGINAPTTVGTASIIAANYSGTYTGSPLSMSYHRVSTSAGTAGSMAEFYESSQKCVSNELGWVFHGKNGFSWQAGTGAYVGLTGSTSATGNVNPSSLTNLICFGADDSDTNLHFMHNDGSGTATKVDMGSDFSLEAINAYSFIMWNLYGENTVNLQIRNLRNNMTFSISVNTNLPATNVGLVSHLCTLNRAVAAPVNHRFSYYSLQRQY